MYVQRDFDDFRTFRAALRNPKRFGGVAKLIASGLSPVPSLSAVIYGRTKLS